MDTMSDVVYLWNSGRFDSKQELADHLGINVRTVYRHLQLDREAKEAASKEQVDDSVVLLPGAVLGSKTDSVWTKNDVIESFTFKQPVIVPQKPTAEYRYVVTSNSITITKIVDSQFVTTATTDKGSDHFREAMEILMDDEFSDEALEEVYVLIQPAKALEKFTHGKLEIDPKNRKIVYRENGNAVPYEVNTKLTDRIIKMVREGDTGVQRLINFLEKLMENPSRRAVEELYGFLEHNDIEIADDGNFYGWKVVRHDYLDKHSATMDNSVGKTLRIPRNMVDEDSSQCCSYGLHVAAKSYLKHFGSNGDRVVKVSVNPADVAAIPASYENAKMRCCGYTVVEDVTKQFESELRRSWSW